MRMVVGIHRVTGGRSDARPESIGFGIVGDIEFERIILEFDELNPPATVDIKGVHTSTSQLAIEFDNAAKTTNTKHNYDLSLLIEGWGT